MLTPITTEIHTRPDTLRVNRPQPITLDPRWIEDEREIYDADPTGGTVSQYA